MSISIVIPVYNAQDHLAETIESCLNQNVDLIHEIILINDHSTDGSQTVIDKYLRAHPELILSIVNEGNKGAPVARNIGLQHATGDYIQFLDADDLLSNNKLKAQYAQLKGKSKYAVATCSWYRFQDNITQAETRRQDIDKSYANPWEWLVDSWTGKGAGQTGIWLVSKDLIDETTGFNESLDKNQDGDFFARVLIRADQILFSDEAAVYYRDISPTSISKSQDEKAAWSVLKSYMEYEKILKFKDIPKVRKALCTNYYRFIYQYYNHYNGLAEEAMKRAANLGFTPFEYHERSLFSFLSNRIGYKNTFKLRQLVKGY